MSALRADSPGLPADLPAPPGNAAPSANSPSPEETRRFQRHYRPAEKGADADAPAPSHPGTRDETEKAGDESVSSLMSRLFSERQGQSALSGAASAPADMAAPVEQAEQLEHLVRQILVSDPDRVGEQEVRLLLDHPLLPETEVRLVRGGDGLLQVTLATGDGSALQTLVAAQDALKERLAAHERQDVRVTVLDVRKEDADSGRRSAGYRAYGETEDA